MTAPIAVKICGIRSSSDMAAAAATGVRYVGFNFFAKSPRCIDMQNARNLAHMAPPGLAKVALVVDAPDIMLDALIAAVPLDMLQLHGSEPPGRVAALRARHGLPVMKVVALADKHDLVGLATYENVADQILVDAKPPPSADLPGGNGICFDWRLITGREWAVPWMLAGGLNAENVAEAIRATGARQVDVASGVETAPGEKSAARINAFVAAAQAAFMPPGA